MTKFKAVDCILTFNYETQIEKVLSLFFGQSTVMSLNVNSTFQTFFCHVKTNVKIGLAFHFKL